jgi:ribosomal protein L37E
MDAKPSEVHCGNCKRRVKPEENYCYACAFPILHVRAPEAEKKAAAKRVTSLTLLYILGAVAAVVVLVVGLNVLMSHSAPATTHQVTYAQQR